MRHERGRPSGRAEERVIESLNSSSIESYYPTYEWTDMLRHRKVTSRKSLFPGYMFARFSVDSPQRWAAVSIAGVAGIVSIGLIPAAIPEDQIEAVRRLLASPMSATPYPHPHLNYGDRVRVEYGPLRGQEGVVIEYRGRHQAVIVIVIEGIDQAIKTHVLREHIRPVKTSNAA